GLPYIIHPIQLAPILTHMPLHPPTILPAFLHHLIQHTSYTFQDLKHIFNQQIPPILHPLTKLKNLNYPSKQQQQPQNHPKLFIPI
ncbi:HD domain-containing protein, partial [Staphylococcus epidermidis]|uniref:HD domain-containing protein n=1 Tax=Staphylococcus epidermidis TaxID=1282 RepID=UPI0011A65FBC